MEIKISIIVPVFNTDAYLVECLDSIIYQSIKEIEIIIINDASTDGSLNIIQEKKLHDDRIKLINLEENTSGGAGIPSNLGIEKASGKYIGFVDSDDFIEPDMFMKLFTEAERNNLDVVCCNFDVFNEKLRCFEKSNDRYYYDSLEKGSRMTISKEIKSSLFRLSPVPWRKLYKKDYLNNKMIRFPEGDFFYEDTPFHYFVIAQVQRIAAIDDVLYHHRILRDEQTMAGKGNKFMAFLDHTKIIYLFLKDELLFDLYLTDFFSFSYNTFRWVWDRLYAIQRKEYFHKLNEIFHLISEDKLISYWKIGIPWESLMVHKIYDNKYFSFLCLLYIKKMKLDSLVMFFEYLRKNGFLKTMEKLKKRITLG